MFRFWSSCVYQSQKKKSLWEQNIVAHLTSPHPSSQLFVSLGLRIGKPTELTRLLSPPAYKNSPVVAERRRAAVPPVLVFSRQGGFAAGCVQLMALSFMCSGSGGCNLLSVDFGCVFRVWRWSVIAAEGAELCTWATSVSVRAALNVASLERRNSSRRWLSTRIWLIGMIESTAVLSELWIIAEFQMSKITERWGRLDRRVGAAGRWELPVAAGMMGWMFRDLELIR